jgi:hypothetical protein
METTKQIMGDECTVCEADDELLFTCGHCGERFCSTHQFPHHACEGFGRGGDADDRPDDPEQPPSSALDGDTGAGTAADADPDAGDRAESDGTVGPTPGGGSRPVTVTPPQPSPRAKSLSAGVRGRSALSVGTSEGVVNVRPMDSRRVVGGTEATAAPRTVGDWIGRQTYLTLTLKIGVIALLVNVAFYGGMALTLYGLLPFAL